MSDGGVQRPSGQALTRPDRRWRPPSVFATVADEPRARRASDLVLLVGSGAALALISVAARPEPAFSRALVRLLQTLPHLFDPLWEISLDLLAATAALILLLALVKRRFAVARDLLGAGLAAAALWAGLARAVVGDWPSGWDSLQLEIVAPMYPSLRLVAPAALLLAAAPHLTRPVRRLGHRIIGLAVVSAVILDATTPLGAIAAVLAAVAAAAVVHLVFGSSGGRPSLALVRFALADLGVATTELHPAERQASGLFEVATTDPEGQPLVVKVYGRDSHDAALLSTVWRTVWYREAGAPLRFGRLQQVEHEAFLTLFARQAGITTDTVVTAGATQDDDALLVLRRQGEVLSDLAPGAVPDDLVTQAWALRAGLGDAGLAHGQLDDDHLLLDGDRLGVAGFRGATLAATGREQRIDEVQVLVTTASLVGVEPAVRGARAALGVDGIQTMLPYLQASVLTRRQRRTTAAELDIDQLRADTAAAAGVEEPELQRLRRLTFASIARVLLPAVAVVMLLSAFAGLDFAELQAQVRDATPWLLALAFVIGQLPRVSQAVSTLGSSPVPLALGPVYALQLAVSYINLAIPTAAARIAINIRFFQRHGLPPATSMAASALDSVGGLIVQAALLFGLVFFGSATLDLDVRGAADQAQSLLLVALIVVVVAVAVVLLVPRLRAFVLGWTRRLATEAMAAVRNLRSPRRVAQILGGNLATEVLFALALLTMVRALGYSVGLGEVLLINISIALLSGLVPIPGGVGVAEGGLSFGLVQAGVPEEVALTAVLLHRLATFYLPPLWGYFALRWLERNQHL